MQYYYSHEKNKKKNTVSQLVFFGTKNYSHIGKSSDIITFINNSLYENTICHLAWFNHNSSWQI